MVSLLRYINGYVEFCAEGGFPERFLNLCKINQISLWDMKNDGVKVEACTTKREFEKIQTPAENSGMSIKILKKKGIPFFTKRHKWRCGAVFGIVLTFLLIWYLSGAIWDVEIAEESGVKIEDFTDTLASLGVREGARKSRIDILEVQEQLLLQYPELSWVSLNIFGNKARVEYTPARKAPEIIDRNLPANVVAAKDGKITLIEGYSGTNVVKEGAFVAKGSLLISGVVINGDASENFIHARGKVFARTQNQVKKVNSKEYKGKLTEGHNKRYKINILNFFIPLGLSPEGDLLSETSMNLKGNSVVLPVGVVREDANGLKEKTITLNKNEAILTGLIQCVEEKRDSFNTTEIKKVVFKTEDKKGKISVCMKVTCIEDIAQEQRFSVEEN